jgi:hypothetical protein
MPRFHRINGARIQFTPDEETARDAEESAWAAEKVTADERTATIDALKVKIADGSATHSELLEFTQYSIGSK